MLQELLVAWDGDPQMPRLPHTRLWIRGGFVVSAQRKKAFHKREEKESTQRRGLGDQ